MYSESHWDAELDILTIGMQGTLLLHTWNVPAEYFRIW